MQTKTDLLETLRIKAKCLYISDLHNPLHSKAVYCAVSDIAPEDHTAAEWREAGAYILHQNISGDDAHVIKDYIIKNLMQQPDA